MASFGMVFILWLDVFGTKNVSFFAISHNLYSQWQQLASQIDKGTTPLCVPLDPLGWMYIRDCSLLNIDLTAPDGLEGFHFDSGVTYSLEIHPSPSLVEKNLISLAVLVAPVTDLLKADNQVNTRATVVLKNGSREVFMGQQNLPSRGGLVMLNSKTSVPIKNINFIKFEFSRGVFLSSLPSSGRNNLRREPLILWMGN